MSNAIIRMGGTMSNAMMTDCIETEPILDFDSWCGRTLETIQEKRRRLERWIAELSDLVEKTGAAGCEHDEGVCQHARMVVEDGETLHCFTQIYVLLSHRKVPPEAWDVALAEKADRLLRKAPGAISVEEWQRNCQERLEYAQKRWCDWCPSYTPPPNGSETLR